MATQRVQVTASFRYPTTVYVATTSGGSATDLITVNVPAVGSNITITNRDTGGPATVYAAATGSSTISSPVTDSGGNVPGWVVEGSYTIVAASVGSFVGASLNWEAVRGDGVENIYAGSVSAATLGTDVQAMLVPSGTVLDFAGGVAPSGFIFADGAVYAQATYPNLYTAIGATWNTGGEGAGNFRVPNLRSKVTVGSSAATGGAPALQTGLTARTLGTYTSGAEIVNADLAAHSHGVTDPGHAHSVYDPSHAHSVADPGHGHTWGYGYAIYYTGGNVGLVAVGTGTSFGSTSANGTGIGIYGAYTGISIYGAATGVSVNSAGAGGGHNNLQPFNVVTKIIKY